MKVKKTSVQENREEKDGEGKTKKKKKKKKKTIVEEGISEFKDKKSIRLMILLMLYML